MRLAPSVATIVVLVGLSLVLSACGGGEETSEPKAPEAPSETEQVAAQVARGF